MSANVQALEAMRPVVEALVIGPGEIRTRLQAAATPFWTVFTMPMLTPSEERLRLRIGAGLVEGGPDDDDTQDDNGDEDADDAAIALAIESLDEKRASEIARDMLWLFEIFAGIRSDDGYNG